MQSRSLRGLHKVWRRYRTDFQTTVQTPGAVGDGYRSVFTQGTRHQVGAILRQQLHKQQALFRPGINCKPAGQQAAASHRRAYQSWPSRYTGYGQGRGLDGDTAVKGLIGANLAGWLLWQSNPGFMKRHFMVSYESVSNLRLHTLLTAAFSQFDGWHLFSNMFALYFFGRDIGRMLGGRKLIHLYVAGAVVGSLAHIGAQLWQTRNSVYKFMPPALGASGAVNALVVFSVLLQPYATVLIYGILPLPAFAFGGLWLFYDLRGLFTQAPGVAYAGHLGGAAVGAASYLAFRRRLF